MSGGAIELYRSKQQATGNRQQATGNRQQAVTRSPVDLGPSAVALRLREVADLSSMLLASEEPFGPSAGEVAARLEEACGLSTLCLSLAAAGEVLRTDGGIRHR